MKYHPDRNTHKTDNEKRELQEKFKKVSEAFEVLSDPKKKNMYDNGMNPNDSENQGGGFHDPNEIFKMFMHPGGGDGGFSFGGGDDGGFSFGGGQPLYCTDQRSVMTRDSM